MLKGVDALQSPRGGRTGSPFGADLFHSSVGVEVDIPFAGVEVPPSWRSSVRRVETEGVGAGRWGFAVVVVPLGLAEG